MTLTDIQKPPIFVSSDPIQPFRDNDFQAQAALYFLPQGHYLFCWQDGSGLSGSKFVTPDDLQAAFANAERDSGWLPPGILRAGYGKHGEWFVLHVPPRRASLDLLELGVITIPLPDLILAGCGRSYHLWALKEPVSLQARLFDAPLPNVHPGGQICWGNNTPPAASPDTAQAALRLFFESPFNDHLVQNKTRFHKTDVRRLLIRLDGKNRFPPGQLISGLGTLNAAVQRLFK